MKIYIRNDDSLGSLGDYRTTANYSMPDTSGYHNCKLALTSASYLACSPSQTQDFWSRNPGLCSVSPLASCQNESGLD